MKLKLKPSQTNTHPFKGVLMKGDDPYRWLQDMELFDLEWLAIRLYPIESPHQPGQLWGCLAVTDTVLPATVLSKHVFCQLVNDIVFIPEYTRLTPALHAEDIVHCFGADLHLFHMELGLVRLVHPVSLQDLLPMPEARPASAQSPVSGFKLPDRITAFEVISSSPEEVMRQMDETFSTGEPLPDDSLSNWEKLKLGFYNLLFNKDQDQPAATSTLGQWWDRLFSRSGQMDKMMQDYERLLQRNQKELDKLLDMMKKDPGKALRFALPLGNDGLGRGGSMGSFKFGENRNDLSLQGSASGGGGGGIDIGDHYDKLQEQYRLSAQELKDAGDFEKAAFIHLKLLKDPLMAAGILEEGHLYQEAASIYLTHVKDKQRAAACYEKGMMLQAAIDLYSDLKMHEKVGDLYTKLGNEALAREFYQLRFDEIVSRSLYLEASVFALDKLYDHELSQQMALRGWQMNRNTLPCLQRYFDLQEGNDQLLSAIRQMHRTEVSHKNRQQFIQAVKGVHNQNPVIKESVRDILYRLVADEAVVNPAIVRILSDLEDQSAEVGKDINRFVGNRHRRY